MIVTISLLDVRMYYPYFFSNKFEMETVFKLKKEIDKGSILPIIEMFQVGSETVKTTAKILHSDTSFVLVLNPYNQRKDPSDRNSVDNIIESLKNYDAEKIIYGLYIDQEHLDDNSALVDQLSHKTFALFHKTTKDIDINKILEIAKKSNVKYHFFLDDTVSSEYHLKFNSCGKKVIIEDPVHKQKVNAEYKKNDDEAFYDLHIRYKTLGFDGFGDYLTIGGVPSDAGGKAPATVVIHYTYPKDEAKEKIWIKRFFGDINKENEKINDGVLKAMREASHFIEDNINGSCYLCDDCKDLIASAKKGNSYELGKLKQFSMMHHVNMIIKLINP